MSSQHLIHHIASCQDCGRSCGSDALSNHVRGAATLAWAHNHAHVHGHHDLELRLRALARHEHDDLSIGEEAADTIDRKNCEIEFLRDALIRARRASQR